MLSRIKERKLVQWLIGYAVAASVILQGLQLVTEAFGGFVPVLQAALILAVVGLPIVAVLAWFHGEKGRQRVTLAEAGILVLVASVSGGVVFGFGVNHLVETPVVAAVHATALDSLRVAVMPLRKGTGVAEDIDETLIHDALVRWHGIEVVDPARVRGALDTIGGARASDQAATRLGAGRYIDGSLSRASPGLRVRVALVDTRTGERLADAAASVPSGGRLEATTAEILVRQLLFPDADPGLSLNGDPGTRSYPAARAFAAARQALRAGSLTAADRHLGRALDADPNYARAMLWRAQVWTWAASQAAELTGVRELAEAALAEDGGLGDRERRLAEAIVLLGQERFAEACRVYDDLRHLDDRDFAAWYGLGECRARDGYAGRDPTSPSGWSFRSSYHRAAQAYLRAFRLLPSPDLGISSGILERVGDRLKVATGAVRIGRALPPDTLNLLARPAWEGDTLAFVPYPPARIRTSDPRTRPATHWTAIERQRRAYNEIAESWASRFPDSPEALQALAHTRELLADPRALETLDAARAETTDPGRRRLLAAEKIRLLVKFGAPDGYDRARVLADSVLAGAPEVAEQGDHPLTLSVIAALMGRAHHAATWSRRAAQPLRWPVLVPGAVTGAAEALAAYAALGGPADSITAGVEEVLAALGNRVPREDHIAARNILMARPVSLAYVAGIGVEDLAAYGAYYPLILAQAAHARNANAEALRILAGIRDRRRELDLRPAEIAFDALLPEAWLWAELGDTLTAAVMLDETLNTLRWAEPGSLDDAVRAGSLVRAMALRAELADATGDDATARRWAAAVAALWANADPPLQPTIRRMRRILDSRRPAAAATRPTLPDGGLSWHPRPLS